MLQNFYQISHLKEPNSFRNRLVLLSVFLFIAPIALITSIFSLVTFTQASEAPEFIHPIDPNSGVYVYASLPNELPSVSGQVLGVDARSDVLRGYIEVKAPSSPLLPHVDYLVEMADKYDLDFRLLVAISVKESGICRLIPSDSHNCWGWGIHSAGTLRFDNYEESIEAVSAGIRKNYHNEGLMTPGEIMTKWVPHSPEGIWAVGVNQFMSEME